MPRSPPHNPIAGCPAAPIDATSCLLSCPASTMIATSRVCESVTRRPLTKLVSQPSCFSVRLSAAPPPCTTTTWWPSRQRPGMAAANFFTSSLSSSAAPPIFTTSFIAVPPSRRNQTSGSCSAPPVRPRPSKGCRCTRPAPPAYHPARARTRCRSSSCRAKT